MHQHCWILAGPSRHYPKLTKVAVILLNLHAEASYLMEGVNRSVFSAPLLDKELLGLDFTTVDHNNTGATKESTTATSRVDSEAHAPPDVTEGQANQGATQTVEQQLLLLGLDTTKTTWWSSKDGSNLELSLAAKTVLEGLPNLDFLLAETLLVST